ncbi:2-iminobutanoate/2-iminopropanoate deaminase [Ekhidna lutea]|uniref:2-iminobutanoate/2-iminopropanoate deaminase n=1 Tax=Ekhidna lutea TaxID=447679 RepID=A0A239KN53_EKHLU|nr:RidA family protein [Ekhidna lutea]SNT19806.1 2-iminobutanoate/2-iminopropanoate deaminase [Ekhidna lutea]
MKEIINSPKAPAPIGPYSQAIKSGNTLYVSGQIPIDESNGSLVEGSIEEETEQVMKNLGYILEEAGLTFEHVLKCSIFVSSMDNFGRINEVYGKYFQNNPPARETVEVSKLPKGVNVEISCIATF